MTIQDFREDRAASQTFQLSVPLAGALRMDAALCRRSAWSLTSHFGDEPSAHRLQLTEDEQKTLCLNFTVNAVSLPAAERTGAELAEQICDLLSVWTSVAVWPATDGNLKPANTVACRELTVEEWDSVATTLLRARLTQPAFLVAAKWFRRALLATDVMEGFCCCFQVIERISLGYGQHAAAADPSDQCGPAALLVQLTSDLCRHTMRNVRSWRAELMNKNSVHRQQAASLAADSSAAAQEADRLLAGVRELLPEVQAAAQSVLTAVRRCYLGNGPTQSMLADEFSKGGPDQSW